MAPLFLRSRPILRRKSAIMSDDHPERDDGERASHRLCMRGSSRRGGRVAGSFLPQKKGKRLVHVQVRPISVRPCLRPHAIRNSLEPAPRRPLRRARRRARACRPGLSARPVRKLAGRSSGTAIRCPAFGPPRRSSAFGFAGPWGVRSAGPLDAAGTVHATGTVDARGADGRLRPSAASRYGAAGRLLRQCRLSDLWEYRRAKTGACSVRSLSRRPAAAARFLFRPMINRRRVASDPLLRPLTPGARSVQ